MKVLSYFFVLFLVFCSSAGAVNTNDPGKPDTVYLEYGGVTNGALTIKLMLVTDNVGDTNKLSSFSFPLEITNSNPKAKPVLDTTVRATYSGTAVEKWSFQGTHIKSNGRNPGIFPLQYWLTVFGRPSSLGAGRYHFANIVLRLQDTTTICIDTFFEGSFRLRFTKASTNGYGPQWKSSCFKFPGSQGGTGSPKGKAGFSPVLKSLDRNAKSNNKKPGL